MTSQNPRQLNEARKISKISCLLDFGGFTEAQQEQERQKPDCPLIGADGNIFNLMGIASRTLKRNGLRTEATEMRDRITSSGSYEQALAIIGEYVTITAVDGYEAQDEDFCMEEMT